MTTVNLTTYSDADFSQSAVALFTVGGTGLALHMQVRTSATDPTVWLELTTANGLLTVAVDNVTVTMSIPQPKLQNLPPGAYVYSLILSSLAGTKRTEVWRGTLTHNAGPTLWTPSTL